MIFIDREDYISDLKNRISQFPLPGEETPRSRRVLALIGPKGVGKTSILKELLKQGVEKTRFVYVEFRGPYGSAEDLLIDLLFQYRESLKEKAWKENIEKVLKAFGIKILGKEFIEELTTEDNIKLLHQARPSLILRRIEEEACKVCEEDNTRLVIIYDEFQNFLKGVPIKSEERFNVLLDSFMTHFSKSQEWGFNLTKGYPIRILSSSDYTFYRLMGKYLTSYLEEKYVEELAEDWSKELFRQLLRQQGLEADVLAEEYTVRALGGNPSLINSLAMELKGRKGPVALEDVEEIIKKMVQEIYSSFENLEWIAKEILRVLKERRSISLSTLKVLLKGKISEGQFNEGLEELLLANIIQLRSGIISFQNKLIEYAAKEF